MIDSLKRLVNVALDTIGSFLACDKSRLRAMVVRFQQSLQDEPIDLALDLAEERLRELVRSVLSG